MEKQREIWVDNVKVIACILVVLGHFFQSMTKSDVLPANDLYQWFNQTIYYFHVPLFFICSGYLYQKLSVVNDAHSLGRNTYGTIIVDEKTHEPVILLDGRNGDTLREWLKHNKNIKVVTRDRASAYAKVIAEELPDAMQVADRFHLHRNLLEAVKKALNHELPAAINIPHANKSTDLEQPCKKNRIECG